MNEARQEYSHEHMIVLSTYSCFSFSAFLRASNSAFFFSAASTFSFSSFSFANRSSSFAFQYLFYKFTNDNAKHDIQFLKMDP
jgi:hypothetical protein